MFTQVSLISKKKTTDILEVFSDIAAQDITLILVGVFDPEYEKQIKSFIDKDKRILFLGWKNLNELRDIILAADCYLQPGSQSASLQMAICCGVAILIFPHQSHMPYLKNNGFFVSDRSELKERISFLISNNNSLAEMGDASLQLAYKLLDYRKIAARFYIKDKN